MNYRLVVSTTFFLLSSLTSNGGDLADLSRQRASWRQIYIGMRDTTESTAVDTIGKESEAGALTNSRLRSAGTSDPSPQRSWSVLHTSEVASLPAGTGFPVQSGIQIHDLAERSVRSLTLLGKVWGFLKYHHPDATSGLVNWDRELLKILPGIISSHSQRETQTIVSQWISGLSNITPCTVCVHLDTSGLQTKPHLAWLDDSGLLGERLRDQLKAIYLNRVDGRQYSVRLQPMVGNPVFDSEEGYAEVRYPDSGYQILSVFRFWNIIEYWYPYRDLIGESWDEALVQALKGVAPAQDSASFQRSLITLIAKVRDGHANLWSSLKVRPPEGDCQLPINLRWVQGRLIVEGFSSAVGHDAVLLGDIIEDIGGKAPSRWTASNSGYYVGSNDTARAADVAASISRGTCEFTELRLRRPGGSITIHVERQPIGKLDTSDTRRNDRPGEVIQRLDAQTLYVKISSAMPGDILHLFEQAKPADQLVVDLRGYPASAAGQEIAARLLSKPTPYVRYTFVDFTNPGAFRWGATPSIQPVGSRFNGSAAVLVDETTLSSGEFTAMALQASSRAFTVGSQTAGADGNMSAIPIPGGFIAAMSGIGVFYPDGRPTQRVGIKINFPCTPTIDGIRGGRDEVLECALKILKRENALSSPSHQTERSRE